MTANKLNTFYKANNDEAALMKMIIFIVNAV